MPRVEIANFNPELPVVARRPFISEGQKFLPHQPYDWAALGIDLFKVKRLFEAGKVMHPVGGMPPPRSTEAPADAGSGTTEAREAPAGYTGSQEAPEAVLVAPDDDSPDTEEPGLEDLDAIDRMDELRAIAERVGAPKKISKVDQRKAIREHLGI